MSRGDDDLSSLPVLDEPVLREITGAAGMTPLELVELFLEDSQSNLAAMADALAQADREGLNRAAHSMKSSAGNVGAQRLSHLALQLELQTKTVVPQESTLLLARLRAAFAEFDTYIAGNRVSLSV